MKIGFTGKRPKELFGYNGWKYQPLLFKIEELLEKILKDKENIVITGGAQGADMLGFDGAHLVKMKNPELNIKNILYIPFDGYNKNWTYDNNEPFSKVHYQKMIENADKIEICSNEQNNNSYFLRNRKIVDNIDILICIAKITNQLPTGGTGYTVKYALQKNKQIIQLDPFTLKIKYLNKN